MRMRIWLCLLSLLPVVPLACAAHKSRRPLLAPQQRARLQRAVPRVYIKRVYRVADGQAEPGLYKLTLESKAHSPASGRAGTRSLARIDWKPKDPVSTVETHPSIAPLTKLLKSSARPLPAKLQDDGELGTLVKGVDLPEGIYEAVMAPDERGTLQLAGWRLVQASDESPQTENSMIQTSGSAPAGRLYEIAFEREIIVFRPVAVSAPPKENLPRPGPASGIVPVKHEEEAVEGESPLSHSRGPNSSDKLLGQLQSEWKEYLPPPWPARIMVPLIPDDEGRSPVQVYYEGPPMQWEDGRWIPAEPVKKRR